MKTLAQLRNHPAVHEIILESDHGRRTYVINLKTGFATDNGGGQQSGTESTLAEVAAFLENVAAMPAEEKTVSANSFPTMENSLIYLRAFFAYCESGQAGESPFALIPYADAIAAGIPFSETFVHEGNDWAIVAGCDHGPA